MLRAAGGPVVAFRIGPAWAWPALAAVGAVGVGALYPATVAIVGPLTVPGAVAAALLARLALRRRGACVAVAFLLTSLTPGMVGRFAWVPGLGWTSLLFALLVLSPAAGDARRNARLPPLALPVLLYGATVLFAYAISPAPDLGLPILRMTVTGILLFLVATLALRTRQDVTDVLRGISGAAVIVGGYACLQHVGGASTGTGFITSTGQLVDRATAGFGTPNLLGGFLVLLVPLTVGGSVLDRRWRIAHLVGLLLAVGGIYASFSRSALIALLLMPLLLLKGRALLLLLPLAVLAFAVAVPSVLTERFAIGGQEGAEVAVRRDIWSTAGAIWVEKPLVGVGLGGFPGAYTSTRVVGKQFLPDSRFEPPPHAHNLHLQILAEQGLLGFAAFLGLAAAATRNAVRLRRAAERHTAALGATLLASLLSLSVHNLFDVTVVENAGIQLYGVLGLLGAVVSQTTADGPEDGPRPVLAPSVAEGSP